MAKKAVDTKTLQLIAEVKKQKSEIARADRPTWRTNCSFSYLEGSSQTTNLQVESDVRKLIGIAAFVEEKHASYASAASSLSVESPPAFTWCGFSREDWIEDIKTRLMKIQIAAKRRKLEVLEERLNSIISPELRAQIELEAIARELNG